MNNVLYVRDIPLRTGDIVSDVLTIFPVNVWEHWSNVSFLLQVSLLSVVEIGVLPLICGWWLDICSLSMFDATLRDRESSFRLAPGTFMFIHWLVGMVYVYYFASFILLLREVLRPGVLWFLRNLNDPDFSPIQVCISDGNIVTEHSSCDNLYLCR